MDLPRLIYISISYQNSTIKYFSGMTPPHKMGASRRFGMLQYPYSIAGFAVGAIVGLTGVGGGSLMTPLLVLMFGVSPATAVGTDLLYAAITKSAGLAVHARKQNVQWGIVARLAAGSIPGALATIAALS